MNKYQLSIEFMYAKINQIHHVTEDGTLWASSRRNILQRHNLHWHKLTRFPFHFPRDLFGWCRPSSRAFRADKCNLMVNSSGNLLAIRAGKVYTFRDKKLIPLFSIQGDCTLHHGIAEGSDGCLYFGEYFMNPKRNPVNIWRVDPHMQLWEPAHTFPPGTIRHVHGIFRDPFHPHSLWATVGDAAGECFLIHTPNHFKTITRFGDGSQLWRAVNLFFTRDHINWLTDSNLEQNHACRLERRSGKLEVGQQIECSGWYGTTTADGLHVAFTTVEPGTGIHSIHASMMVSRDAFQWETIHQFTKDKWRPMKLFKYGVISVPSGSMKAGELYISGEGLSGFDGCSLKVKISPKESKT